MGKRRPKPKKIRDHLAVDVAAIAIRMGGTDAGRMSSLPISNDGLVALQRLPSPSVIGILRDLDGMNCQDECQYLLGGMVCFSQPDIPSVE